MSKDDQGFPAKSFGRAVHVFCQANKAMASGGEQELKIQEFMLPWFRLGVYPHRMLKVPYEEL